MVGGTFGISKRGSPHQDGAVKLPIAPISLNHPAHLFGRGCVMRILGTPVATVLRQQQSRQIVATSSVGPPSAC